MKVILLKDIAKLGKRGEVKEVADGFAINVLIKKGDALQATPGELAKWKAKEDAKVHKKEVETNAFVALADTLRNHELTITNKKYDDKGQLFAQVKETDIVDTIFAATKISIDPKQVILSAHIKAKGKHQFTLKQGDKQAQFTIVVA